MVDLRFTFLWRHVRKRNDLHCVSYPFLAILSKQQAEAWYIFLDSLGPTPPSNTFKQDHHSEVR